MKARNIIINWSIEFAPIILYFVLLAISGDSKTGFVISTGIFTLMTALALFVAYTREGRIAVFAGLSGLFIIVFGVATVWFDMPWVFMFEATVYNSIFALILLPGLLTGKGYLKKFFIGLFDIDDRGWFILSFRYFLLFLLTAIVNEYIWRNYSQSAWIINKYIASASAILLGFFQIPLGKRHRNPTASSWGVRVTSKADSKYRKSEPPIIMQ